MYAVEGDEEEVDGSSAARRVMARAGNRDCRRVQTERPRTPAPMTRMGSLAVEGRDGGVGVDVERGSMLAVSR